MFLVPARLLEALPQLVRHRLQARRGLGRRLHVIIDLGRFLHRLAADRQTRIVDLRRHRRGNRPDVGHHAEKAHIALQLKGLERGGQDIRVVLGGIQSVLNEGNAIDPGLEQGSPLLGGQIDQEGEFFLDERKGVLDSLDILGRKGGVDVLVRHGWVPIRLGFVLSNDMWIPTHAGRTEIRLDTG